MLNGMIRALRFGKEWKLGNARLRETELDLRHSHRPIPATLLVPEGSTRPLPGWVTLHGITRPGRSHPTLLRFVRALAASGSAVLVPEIRAWRDMLLAPEEAAGVLRASVLDLADRREVAPGRLGVMGFSFGGPQALLAGADPVVRPHLKAVASFGGYCDLERALRFLFTGEHEWQGRCYRNDPDPYGRWVAGGNLLPRARGYEGTEEVAEALMSLAKAAGDLQIASWDAQFDARKSELETGLSPAQKALFRVFAPGQGEEIPHEMVETLVPALAEAARGASPLFDLASQPPDLGASVYLIHGRQDRLIPFTETLRLQERLAPGKVGGVFLTGLFGHSTRDGRGQRVRELGEQLHFLRLISVLLGSL
jgi:hypothetical protein